MQVCETVAPPKRAVGPVFISTTSYSQLVALCLKWARDRKVASAPKAHYMCVTSAHGVILAQDNAEFAGFINSADVATPDGMPIVWALRSFGQKDQQRVYGPTLMLHLCEAFARDGLSIFLYGSAEETLETLKVKLKELYPGLTVAGSYSPPFRPLTQAEDSRIRQMICQSDPDLIFIGMGTPKQEQWMHEHRNCFPGMTMIGVGAAFDFHAGTTRQAPIWIQNSGLEWLFRLAMEPMRLWRRYLLITPRFLPLWFRQLWRNRT